jgi:hydrogenase nickel incorporation protein HypA/HybF
MHELTIAQSIISMTLSATDGQNVQKINRVNVRAGELRGIVPTLLTFYFGLAAENTIAAGAELCVEYVPPLGKCRACDNVFPIKNYRYICPKCNAVDVQIIAGTELLLKDIEVI